MLSNSAVLLRSRDRGSEDAVVFPGIGGDGYFDYKGSGRRIFFACDIDNSAGTESTGIASVIRFGIGSQTNQ